MIYLILDDYDQIWGYYNTKALAEKYVKENSTSHDRLKIMAVGNLNSK